VRTNDQVTSFKANAAKRLMIFQLFLYSFEPVVRQQPD